MASRLDSLAAKIKRKKQHFKTDAYIVSYPKCGRTWLRVLLGKYLCMRHDLPESMLLDTYQLTEAAGMLRTQMVHDLESQPVGIDYRRLNPNKQEYRRKKIIFLARDVRDVMVSCYFQATRRRDFFQGTMSDFIRSDRFGIRKLITYNTIWQKNRSVPKEFLLVRYEDLHADPHAVLADVLAVLGAAQINRDVIAAAIEYSRFDNMRSMEEKEIFQGGKLRPKDMQDKESFKVRKGVIGGYKDYLSPDDIFYIDAVMKEMGNPFHDAD